METKFDTKIETVKKKLDFLQKRFNQYGNLKIIIFIINLIALYYVVTKNNNIFFVAFNIAVFIILIYLFYKQHLIKKNIQYCKEIININNEYKSRISGEWSSFQDFGEEFIDNSHPFSSDLDIVGKKSLFQLLNTSHTYFGRITFANKLISPNKDINEIKLNQDSTKELSQMLDFCQDLEFHTQKVKDDKSIVDLIEFLKQQNHFIKNKFLIYFLIIMPLLTATITFSGYIFNIVILKNISSGLIIAQQIIWIIGFLKILDYKKGVSHYSNKLSGYKSLLQLIEKTEFKSTKLKKQYEILFGDFSSSKAIKELDRILQKFDVQHNPILYYGLNVFLLWDYEACFSLDKWRTKYCMYVENWFMSIAEIESLASLSVLNNITENISYPNLDKNDMSINFKTIGHPLLSNSKRINNSFLLDDKISIISGSNMSGKTTFLRTIGINLVLCYSGSVVCAENMSVPILDIVTSMRIADDLNEGISTFYAELLKIKQIINRSKKDNKMIFLIDEIFRGTNSADRLFGAETVIKNLDKNKVIGLITTHDLEICKLSQNNRIVNYHFKEQYVNNKITFDYKLCSGVSTTTNAKHLMAMVGITDV